MRWVVVLLLLAAGCPPPAQFREVRPGLSCDRATRVGYRTMTELGYTVTELVPATVGTNGSIVGTKTKRDGTHTTGRVRVECTADGATLVPIEDSIAPDYEFSRAFGYSFKELVKQPDVQAPRAEMGLEVLVKALSPQESTLDLGGPATVGGAVAGGAIGALVGMGIPEARLKKYEKDLKQGGILMGIRPRTPEDRKYFEEQQWDYEQHEASVTGRRGE